MAGTITHSWQGTVLTITSDSGTSSADLQGGKGDTGPRGAQGPAGIIVNPDGTIDTSQYATETYVNEKIAQVEAGSVDLTNYYTKAQVDAKIPDITGLASQTWVENKGYLTEHQSLKTINGESIVGTGNITISGGSVDLSNYYTKSIIYEALIEMLEIDAISFTTDYDNKGYLTEHQSLANYALKTEIPDVSQYQTATQVQTLINNALGVIENGAY